MALKEKGRHVEQQRQTQQTVDEELGMIYRMREPDGPSAFETFAAELEDEQRPFAKLYWTMQCDHAHEEKVAVDASGAPIMVRCTDCGIVRRWQGTRGATKVQEWMSYCPDGFDMFEWQDLYVRDRSMWQFIHDEVLAEQVTITLAEEGT